MLRNYKDFTALRHRDSLTKIGSVLRRYLDQISRKMVPQET